MHVCLTLHEFPVQPVAATSNPPTSSALHTTMWRRLVPSPWSTSSRDHL